MGDFKKQVNRLQDLLLQSGKEIAVGLITAIGALFVFLLKNFFAERKRRIKAAEIEIKKVREKSEKQIDELKCLMVNIKDDVRKSYELLKDKINENEKQQIKDHAEIRGRLEVVSQAVSGYSENVSKLSGRVDDQLNMTASHIATISHMSKQITALFKIADAKKRASDVDASKDPNGHDDT